MAELYSDAPMQAPYYAVIFTSYLQPGEHPEYEATAEQILKLASQQDGFLGFETARDADGLGISISYWRDRQAISDWQQNAQHLDAQRRGKEHWYASYRIHVAKVERHYTSETAH